GGVLFADEEVDAGGLRLDPDQLAPLGIVGHGVGLDHPEGSTVLGDDVVLDVPAPLERGTPLFDGDLERVAPPRGDVLSAKPGFDLRRVGVLELPELDHAARRRSESRARSSWTFSVRQASAYARMPPAIARPSETICATTERPSSVSSPRQTK